MRTWFVGLLAIVIGILLAPSAFAQNAQITGSVKDSSGAIIPGATVTARNVDTGLTRAAVTDGSGRVPPAVAAAGPLFGRDRAERLQHRDPARHRPDHRPDRDHQFRAEAGGDCPKPSPSPASRRSSTSRDRTCRRRCRRSRSRICRWRRAAGSISRC